MPMSYGRHALIGSRDRSFLPAAVGVRSSCVIREKNSESHRERPGLFTSRSSRRCLCFPPMACGCACGEPIGEEEDLDWRTIAGPRGGIRPWPRRDAAVDSTSARRLTRRRVSWRWKKAFGKMTRCTARDFRGFWSCCGCIPSTCSEDLWPPTVKGHVL
ncbi:hypothetical protein EJB05_28766 [Eragrostis curvula]|uniref:Uncharacterized protein n=1 Tax=Eragrostis curvula TaxID=38414 RepID=A0A5J9UQU3_9POAL|nr:hypothetical protein EJB05_28766 [Eragrostis curvula]